MLDVRQTNEGFTFNGERRKIMHGFIGCEHDSQDGEVSVAVFES